MNTATKAAKPTQIPFLIPTQKVIAIIRSVEAKGGYRYSGYAFGESNPDALVEMIQSLPSNDNMLKVSKVANEIKRHETGKLPGNANAALSLIIKLINESKVRADQH